MPNLQSDVVCSDVGLASGDLSLEEACLGRLCDRRVRAVAFLPGMTEQALRLATVDDEPVSLDASQADYGEGIEA